MHDSAYHIEVNNHMATRNLFLEMKGSTIANQFVAFFIVHKQVYMSKVKLMPVD